MKMKHQTGFLGRVRAAVDGWVRSFTTRDAELYIDREMANGKRSHHSKGGSPSRRSLGVCPLDL